MDIVRVVRGEIIGALSARGLRTTAIAEDDALIATLGLSSLEVVALSIRLNALIGTDPFSTGVAITDMRTVRDLIRAYQGARSTKATERGALLESVRRAELRRKRSPG